VDKVWLIDGGSRFNNIILPPRTQRQIAQSRCGRLNVCPKRDDTNDHAQHVGDIVSVSVDGADAALRHAAMLLALERTAEFGKWIRERLCWFCGRCACCDCECVDEFEDKDSGEGSAEVGDAS
jgi:hypothetical protein